MLGLNSAQLKARRKKWKEKNQVLDRERFGNMLKQ